MLHAKFEDHRSSGSPEEDFKWFVHVPYIGVAAILVMYINFRSPSPRRLHMKVDVICQAVSENMFE